MPCEKSGRVVFLGDSITKDWKLDEAFPGMEWINRGIGGQRTSQIVGRYIGDVRPLRPRVVFFLGGTNDLAAGEPVAGIVDNVRGLAGLCKGDGTRLIVASVLPVSDYHAEKGPAYRMTQERPPAKIVELNERLRALCGEEKVRFLDLHALLADASGLMPAALADDGLHPSAAGYEKISPAARAVIEEEFAR